MTFAYNMFILAILASAAGVQLLPVPDAIVSPVFIPGSCQISSQAAEEMLRPRWESRAGEAALVPACPPGALGGGSSRGKCPGGLLPALPRAAVPAAGGPPSRRHRAGSDPGVLGGACGWRKIKVRWNGICN